jgi:hypothetical protein
MSAVLRLSGLAAIAAGVLRIANVFTTGVLSQGTLAALYFLTDVLLLAGVTGLWLKRRGTLGLCATAGLAIFVLGILTIRASAFGIGSYQLGATVALIGLALYSVETLLRRNAAPLAPVLWLVSLAAGIAATAGIVPLPMMALAGVAFGAGFVAAGWQVLRA